MGHNFDLLSDAELDMVTGGVRVGVSIDRGGIAVSGPLGEIRVPSPLSLVGNVVNGALNAAGGVLQGAGGALSALGRLLGGGR